MGVGQRTQQGRRHGTRRELGRIPEREREAIVAPWARNDPEGLAALGFHPRSQPWNEPARENPDDTRLGHPTRSDLNDQMLKRELNPKASALTRRPAANGADQAATGSSRVQMERARSTAGACRQATPTCQPAEGSCEHSPASTASPWHLAEPRQSCSELTVPASRHPNGPSGNAKRGT